MAAGHRARRAETVASLLVLSGGGLLTVLIGGALYTANTLYVHLKGPAISLLRPHPLTWLLFAFPVGFSVALLAYDPIRDHLKGPAPPSFSVDYILASGYLPRWLRRVALLVAATFGLLAALNVPYHARFTERAFYDQRVCDLKERERPYSDVSAVVLARYYVSGARYSAGGPSRSRSVFITLKDGTRWSPACSMLAADAELSTSIAEDVSRRSGLPIEYPEQILGMPSQEQQRAGNLRGLLFNSAGLIAIVAAGLRWRRQNKRAPVTGAARK